MVTVEIGSINIIVATVHIFLIFTLTRCLLPSKIYLIIGFNMPSVNGTLALSEARSSTIIDSAFNCAYTSKQAEKMPKKLAE